MDQKRTRIAIACQGGGSHCAYTAGVLSAALQRTRAEEDRLVLDDHYEIVGLTGTSGPMATGCPTPRSSDWRSCAGRRSFQS